MNSALTITLRPESPRTIAPIEAKVLGDGAAGARVVVSSSRGDLFPVETKEIPGGRSGVFWLQEAGDYRVRATSGAAEAARDFRVREQVFLGFGAEFGLFLVTLVIAGGGLILWFRNRKRVGLISPSSPS